jgi:hypothetical protein
LPTYAQAGLWAPFILCVLRFGQGLGLGGEWGGAVLLAVENAPPGWRARYGMFPQLGAPAGLFGANGLFLLVGVCLTPAQFHDWGWRVPFAISALLVLVGLWARLTLAETTAFAASLKQAPPSRIPFGELVSRHGRALIAGILGAIGCFALYYVATAFTLSYGTKTLGYPMQRLLGAQLAAIPFLGLGIFLAAWLSDRRFTEWRVLSGGFVGVFLAGFLISPMMESGSLSLVYAYLALSLLLMGFVYGPLSGWLPSLFPPRVRYTGVSIAFNGAGVLGGGLTPIIATTLSAGGRLAPVGLYVGGTAVLSLIAVLVMRGGRAAIVPTVTEIPALL